MASLWNHIFMLFLKMSFIRRQLVAIEMVFGALPTFDRLWSWTRTTCDWPQSEVVGSIIKTVKWVRRHSMSEKKNVRINAIFHNNYCTLIGYPFRWLDRIRLRSNSRLRRNGISPPLESLDLNWLTASSS